MTTLVHAEEFNHLSSFMEHIKGWEWVYMEEGVTRQIKTPYYSVTYKEYASHPNYRVVFEDNMYQGLKTSMTIYDTNGNLVRKLTEVSGWYDLRKTKEEANLITKKELYHIAKEDTIVQTISKLSILRHFESPMSDEDLLRQISNYKYTIGYVDEYSKMKKKDISIIDELNSQIKNQHMQIFKEKGQINCYFDSAYTDSLYKRNITKCFPVGFAQGIWIVDANARGKRAKRLPLSFDSSEQKNAIIDTLCHLQMVSDYMNNMYDVRSNEDAETLMIIEQQLGIRNETKRSSKDSTALENQEVLKDAGKIKCQELGLPIDEKYYTMGEAEIRKEIQKYHPNWTTLEIANRYLNAVQRVTEYLGTYAITQLVVDHAKDASKSSKDAAYNYLSFLINEYQFVVTRIQRIDATTFEATIETSPRGIIHKIIIHYQQTKPYECKKEIRIESSSETITPEKEVVPAEEPTMKEVSVSESIAEDESVSESEDKPEQKLTHKERRTSQRTQKKERTSVDDMYSY